MIYLRGMAKTYVIPDSNVGFWLDMAEEKSLRNGRVMHVQTKVDSKYYTSIRMQRKLHKNNLNLTTRSVAAARSKTECNKSESGYKL